MYESESVFVRWKSFCKNHSMLSSLNCPLEKERNVYSYLGLTLSCLPACESLKRHVKCYWNFNLSVASTEGECIHLLSCKVKVKMFEWNGKTLLSCGHSLLRMLNIFSQVWTLLNIIPHWISSKNWFDVAVNSQNNLYNCLKLAFFFKKIFKLGSRRGLTMKDTSVLCFQKMHRLHSSKLVLLWNVPLGGVPVCTWRLL